MNDVQNFRGGSPPGGLANRPTFHPLGLCVKGNILTEGTSCFYGIFGINERGWRMPYIRKIIRSGDVLEIEEYFYPDAVGQPGRGERHRHGTSSKSKLETQHQTRVKQLSRLVNANFTAGDIFLTLTFRKSVSYEQSKIDLQNYLRRLKRLRKKQGLSQLKYISVTETGKTKMKKHHHLLINKMDMRDAERLWRQGHTIMSSLDPMADYAGLAYYITKENKNKNENRWNRSHNLEAPVVEKYPVRRNSRHIRLPREYAHYHVITEDVYYNDINGSVKYLKAIAPGGHDYAQGSDLLG